jgi:hypothetical protein
MTSKGRLSSSGVACEDSDEKRQLWERIGGFDLNIGKRPALTIVKRYCRENTNDWGETLNVAVGAMMVLEFKKFIFLCALKLEEKIREF